MNVLLMFILFLVLIFLGLPIVHSMLVSSLVYIAFLSGGGLTFYVVPQRMIYGMDSFALMAVPFFILAAEACRKHGKAAGMHIVVPTQENLTDALEEGYSFIAVGTDILFIQKGARDALDMVEHCTQID